MIAVRKRRGTRRGNKEERRWRRYTTEEEVIAESLQCLSNNICVELQTEGREKKRLEEEGDERAIYRPQRIERLLSTVGTQRRHCLQLHEPHGGAPFVVLCASEQKHREKAGTKAFH